MSAAEFSDKKLPVYFDNNATTATDERVLEAMLPFFRNHYGNAASSTHLFGWDAKDAVDDAREKLAALINGDPRKLIFTSGATESVNLALKGGLESLSHRGRHIITCITEHKAVLDTCKHLQGKGWEVSYLDVDKNGTIDPATVQENIRKDTVMISIMYSNNETGVIQPIQEIADITKRNKLLFFSDATQTVGKIRVDVDETGFDMIAFSAHKFYGPKGVGALYVNRKSDWTPVAQMDGGGHEGGLRSGTLNVPSIVGFGKAAELRMNEMQSDEIHIRSLRDQLESSILKLQGTVLNGHPAKRMHNVSNISFEGVEAQRLMMSLSKYMAVSSGSACTSIIQEPSHVLKAMGLDLNRAMNAIRFSLGKFNSLQEINFVTEKVRDILTELRA